MRIAQVAPLYESVPPKLYGGTERVVCWLTEELVRLGHDVTLFASGDSRTSARLVPCCPKSLRLDEGCRDQLAHHFIMLEQVFAEKEAFDLIHFHIDYLHFPISRRERVASLSTLHGRLDMPELVPVYRTYPQMPVVSISSAQREPLPWLNWQQTIYHGMPENAFQVGAGSGGYLAFLGRISPEKGVDKAIEIACASGMPLKIAAKVDRNDRDYFESVVKPLLRSPGVEFVGEIGHREKNEFLGKAAALLFPIDWPEPFGIVMMEAMACGTPVIAFRRGSVPEVIKQNVSGYIVRGVKEAVNALRNVSDFDRLACRRSFEQRFTANRMANDYLNAYQRLLEGVSESLPLTNGALSWMKLTSPSSTT